MAFLHTPSVWEARRFIHRPPAPGRGDVEPRESETLAMMVLDGAHDRPRHSTCSNDSSGNDSSNRSSLSSTSAAVGPTGRPPIGGRSEDRRNCSMGARGERVPRMLSRSLHDGHITASATSEDSTWSHESLRNSLPAKFPPTTVTTTRAAKHGSDPHLNDRHYATQLENGNYVKMGWLTKQGHMWKTWKTRYFVLFHDGTLAYYKSKGKRKMKGCMKLHDGVISVQHVDIRRSQRPHVFQIEKGFYRMWCCCATQMEAELWVAAVRSVRNHAGPPPCLEVRLTLPEEQAAWLAITRHLNKVFVTDSKIVSSMNLFKNAMENQSIDGVNQHIIKLEEIVMDRHLGDLYKEPEIEMMAGNEIIKLIRRFIEDRVFTPLGTDVYNHLDCPRLRAGRANLTKNLKLLKNKAATDFSIPEDLASVSDWKEAREWINSLDHLTLPSHKLEAIISAGAAIIGAIARHHGIYVMIPDEALSCIFRFVVVQSSLEDPASTRALLKPLYTRHPSCQNQSNTVAAFLDAIKWIDSYQASDDTLSDNASIASARVTVSISTPEVGLLFCTDGNGRGAIVHTVRKLSQAALSEKIVPGLALIAVNDEPVILMPFREVCNQVRSAALPKKLTFLSEFFYYQLLSLDAEMYQYLLCLAAARGDIDSIKWIVGSQVDVNELCTWEMTRGKQIFGFLPPASEGTALHAACNHGHPSVVEYLLRVGAKPDVLDRDGRTPLHLVPVSKGMVVLMELLNEAGAPMNASDRQGLTPLMIMAAKGSLEGISTLMALGASVDRTAWPSGYSALEFAVECGNSREVDFLLSKGADPNHITLDGDSSLHLAATRADIKCVRLLLDAKADVNLQNRFGQTPAAALLAVGAGKVDGSALETTLRMLIEAGCEVHRRDLLGRKLLHLSEMTNNSRVSCLVRNLCKNGNPDWCNIDIYGCSSMDYSVDCLTDTDVAHLRVQKARAAWERSEKGRYPSSIGNSCLNESRSTEELLHMILHDATVSLDDVAAFVLFLDSFTSMSNIVNHLRDQLSNNSKARGMVRFVVLLNLFKLKHTKDGVWVEFSRMLERHLSPVVTRVPDLLQEYKRLYQRYFTLRADSKTLILYESIPSRMLGMYGCSTSSPSVKPFPKKLYTRLSPARWAEHCTLVSHALFSSIPVDDFISFGSKKPHSEEFLCAKRWFQHLSAYVVNTVLIETTGDGRADAIAFFLSAAEWCLSLRNYDTLAAILYALQSTAVQRLRRTVDSLPLPSKKLLNQMQVLSDKGCREINKIMRQAPNPTMPYIGLYLQSLVGLNELPIFDRGELINVNRLRKMGEVAVEILQRKSIAYNLAFDDEVDDLLHVCLPYNSDERRYARSLELEPREAGATPLGERPSCVIEDAVDIENEVRESMGSEGTFGIRQWFRIQKVVHRNRSRSSSGSIAYEWV